MPRRANLRFCSAWSFRPLARMSRRDIRRRAVSNRLRARAVLAAALPVQHAGQDAVVGRSGLWHLRIRLEGRLPPWMPIADPRPRNAPLLVRQGDRADLVCPPAWPWACADRLAHSEDRPGPQRRAAATPPPPAPSGIVESRCGYTRPAHSALLPRQRDTRRDPSYRRHGAPPGGGFCSRQPKTAPPQRALPTLQVTLPHAPCLHPHGHAAAPTTSAAAKDRKEDPKGSRQPLIVSRTHNKSLLGLASTGMRLGDRFIDPVSVAIIMSIQSGLILPSEQRVLRVFR